MVELKGYYDIKGPKEIGLVWKYVSGPSLKDILDLKSEEIPGWWTPTQKVITVVSIVLAMRYAHKCGVLHRNLAPSSVLFDENHCVRITGFRSSRDFSPNSSESLFTAPELKSVHHNGAVDVYSFGLIMYQVLCDSSLLSVSNSPEACATFVRQMRDQLRPSIPASVSAVVRELIMKCWSENSAERPSFSEIWKVIDGKFDFIPGVDEDKVTQYVRCRGDTFGVKNPRRLESVKMEDICCGDDVPCYSYDDFEVLKSLELGAFAKALECRQKVDGKLVALKELRESNWDKYNQKRIDN
jgi:serine/threonine protein kinase